MNIPVTQPTLDNVPSHFNWQLEKGTDKSFEALELQLIDHVSQNPEQMTVPAYLFMCFLYVSSFIATPNYKNAKKYLRLAYEKIDDLKEDQIPAWIGYTTVAKANEAIIESKGQYRRSSTPSRNVQKLIGTINELVLKKTDHSEAYVHIARAFALSRLGMSKYKEAEKYFRSAVGVEPENPQWIFGLALTIGRQARYHSGIRIKYLTPEMREEKQLYTKVLTLDTNHTLAMCYLAQVLHIEGNSKDAEKYCLEATSISSTNPSVLRMVGQIFRRKGYYERALRIFKNCEKDGIGSSYLYHHWGLVYRDIYNDSGSSYTGGSNRGRGIRRHGSTGFGASGCGSGGRASRGCGYGGRRRRGRDNRGRGGNGRGSRGRDDMGGIYRMPIDRVDGKKSHENGAYVSQHCEYVSEANIAIGMFKQSLVCNPHNAMALLDKAKMFARIHNMPAAKDDFDQLVRMSSNTGSQRVASHFHYGLFLQNQLREKYEAIDQYRSAIECALHDCIISKSHGRDGFEKPQFTEGAKANINIAIRNFKCMAGKLSELPSSEDRCDGLRQLAWLNYELRDVLDAIRNYKECLQCKDNGNDVEALEGLAKCYMQKEDFSEIEILIRKLQPLDTTIAEKCKLKSKLCQGRKAIKYKKFAEARKFLLESLELNSLESFEDIYTTLQFCSGDERSHWQFRADCAKLLHWYKPNSPDDIASRLSTIDLDQSDLNEEPPIVSFSERVKSLMDLNHSVCGKLRETHLRMEHTILNQTKDGEENKATLDASAEVLSEAHALLSRVMMAFKTTHYPESKPRSCPYYYVSAESEKMTEEEVKTKLLKRLEKDYNWTHPVLFSKQFPELLNYLVKIQPAYSRTNNWYRAVAKLNNIAKHDSSLRHAAYDIPQLFVKGDDDSALPVDVPVYPAKANQPGAKGLLRESGSEMNPCAESKEQNQESPVSDEETKACSVKTVIYGDKTYERYRVRDLARRATTEVEYIVVEFYKYI